MDLDGGVPGWCGGGAASPAPPHTHGTVRMMICGREHRVSIFLLLFCIVCWVVVVGSVGLMHVAVMFVCWFGWLCHKSLSVCVCLDAFGCSVCVGFGLP